MPANDDTRTETCTDGQPDHVRGILSFPKIMLAQCKAIGIIIYKNGDMVSIFKQFLQVNFLPGWDMDHIINNAALHIDNTRHTYADRFYIGIDQLIDERV